MSNTSNVVQYQISAGAGGTTGDGTEYNVSLSITVEPGTDFTDTTAAALQQALVAAMQAPGWPVESSDVWVTKTDSTTVTYATDYAATPVTFS